MNSYAWTNGQHQQAGPPSQFSKAATQLTLYTMWNQQDGTANNSCQYRILNTGVQPPQSAHSSFRNGVHSNRQISNWQSSAVPHKTVSSETPVRGEANTYYLKTLQGNPKNLFTNTQSGNPCLLGTNGRQVATQQDFRPNSGVSSSSPLCPPNMMKANTTYHQQDMSAHWNQQATAQWKQAVRTQGPNVMSDSQNCRVVKGLLQTANGESNKPMSAYTTTATLLPREQKVCTSTLVSATAHNGQTAHNQNHRLTGTQPGIHLIPPPSYHVNVSQSFRNKSIATNSSSNKYILHFSSANQKKTPQQYPVHLNSTYNSGEDTTRRFMSKTNELTLNPAADTQKQMLSQQMIARILDNLHKPFTANSDNCPPVFTYLPHGGNQLVREVRMRESNQNMQPVTLTVTEGCNSNSSQSLPANSGLSLPNSTKGVMTRTQYSVDAPQQSSVPNAYVTATSDGSGNGSKAGNTLFPKSDWVSNGNVVGSFTGASQLMKLPESISPQKNKTDLSVVNNHEVLEILDMLSSVKANDSSIYSSPGRTGMRAVAVVQPLSQESYLVGSKHTSSNTTSHLTENTATDESLHDHEKSFISSAAAENKKTCLQEGPNQMRSPKSIISHSTASSDSTSVTSSYSAEDQDLSQKQLCADVTGSTLSVHMQVDQQVALTAQQSVTSEVPVSQSSDEDKSKNPTDPKALDLSSVPTIPWTAVTLKKLIEDAEKAQMELSRNLTTLDSQRRLFSMFWDGNTKTLVRKVKTSWYKELISNSREFCSKHLRSNSAILTQVKDSCEDQLKSYYVLKDSEVYTEQPYKSSWLNVNEQLDEIDKEFGFSRSLKHRLYTLESRSPSDQVGTVNGIHGQIANEFSNKVLSQTELEPIDSGVEKPAFTVEATSTSTTEATSTQAVSPKETECVDPSDPYYTFEIQVLPPEEAKAIFEQVQNKIPQSIDTDSHPERVMNTSVEGKLPDVKDVALNDSELENKSVGPLEQVCCVSRLMEMFGGPNTPLSKCQCKNEQSLKDCTDKDLAKEDMAVEKEDKLCANTCDSKFNLEGENQTESGENVDCQIKTYSLLELCDELSQTNALTEKNHKPHLFSDKQPENISQININSGESSIIVISEDEDDLSSSDTEIQSGLEVDCVQDQIKSTRSTLSCTSFSSDKENENPRSSGSELACQMSDLEDNCEKAQLKSTDVAESSLETEEQTKICATDALQTTLSLGGKHETVERKWKRQSIHDRFVPLHKTSNKSKNVDVNSQPSTCRKVLIDATDSEPLASNVRTVQLVLFGSALEDKCDLIGSRRRHILSQGAVSDDVPQPPKVVSVNLSPLKKKSNETVRLEEYSVKRWIHEKWMKSCPPAKIRHKSKLKSQKCTFTSLSGVSPKKAEMVGPTNTEKLTVSSDMRICNQNTNRCLSLKRRRSLSNGLKGGEEKKRKDADTLKQPTEQKQSNAENGSLAVTSFQDNVLRFSVLPSTFNFKDGSSERNKANDPVSNNPALVEGKDESANKTITREIGTWYSKPVKKYRPLPSPPVPKASSIFHEFQKKYKEKTQPSMDK